MPLIILFYCSTLYDNGIKISEELKLNKLSKKDILLITILAVSLSILTYFMFMFIPITDTSSKVLEIFSNISTIELITIILIGPIYEEFFFRVLILKELNKSFNIVSSIVIQALIFGIIHFNFQQSLEAFIGGLFLGFVFYQTNSIYSSILLHIANNIMACINLSALLKDNFLIVIPCLIYIIYFIKIYYKNIFKEKFIFRS